MKRRIARAVLLLISLLVTLIGIEIYLRYRINSYWRLIIPPPTSERRYDLRPNAFGRYGGAIMTIDEHGRRWQPKPARTVGPMKKVLFIGDSLIFGLGCNDRFTIPYRFQEECRSRNLPIETINAGVFGYDLRDEWSLLQQLEDLKPALVVWGLFDNDLYDAALHLPGCKEGIVDRICNRFVTILLVKEKWNTLAARLEVQPDAPSETVALRRISQAELISLFQQIKLWSTSHSTPVVLVGIPSPLMLNTDSYLLQDYARFEDAAKASNLIYLNTLFEKMPRHSEISLNALDLIHYNDTGNVLCARALMPSLLPFILQVVDTPDSPLSLSAGDD